MARLYLIRHAEPAAEWAPGGDPGLSALGRAQAADAAGKLAALKPAAIVTSPMLRCRETAAALEMETGLIARVEPAVTEIPTSEELDRRAWLDAFLAGDWRDYSSHEAWRQGVLEAVRAHDDDTAIFSHFVAINAIVGLLQQSTQTSIFKPAHASITVLDAKGGGLSINVLGAETAAVTLL
ncbi:MAG: histidine phosphatase family protein [Hyphomonadaceae bacterium]